jgi:hypothetical protein
MSEWAEFVGSLKWKDILIEYLDAVRRVEHYALHHPNTLLIPCDAVLAISGLISLLPAISRAAEDLTMHDQGCPQSIADTVLASVRRVRRVLPTPDMSMSTAGHA